MSNEKADVYRTKVEHMKDDIVETHVHEGRDEGLDMNFKGAKRGAGVDNLRAFCMHVSANCSRSPP